MSLKMRDTSSFCLQIYHVITNQGLIRGSVKRLVVNYTS